MHYLHIDTYNGAEEAVGRLGYDLVSIQNAGEEHLWAVIGYKKEDPKVFAVWTYNTNNEPEPLSSGIYEIITYTKALQSSFIKAERHAT